MHFTLLKFSKGAILLPENFFKNFLTSCLKFVKNIFVMIKIEDIFGLKTNNWWCWEKKEGEICPAPS
jgi:hypothetical protein